MANSYAIPADFEWLPEYDSILDQVASTDVVETEWTMLRNIIKYKIDKNIALYLSEGDNSRNQSPMQNFSPRPSTSDGLKLPPFPPRPQDESNPNEVPKTFLNQQEADDMKAAMFSQLHEFAENPPFTIQRVCELCLRPKQHYKIIGKYLRALEKSLLVTSTWDAFPQPTPHNKNTFSSAPLALNVTPIHSAPATPLFSPIPFLHADARRSTSRSPPPSPLALTAIDSGVGIKDQRAVLGPHDTEQKVLGLVDEMDDPSPGHLSERPTALTSVTDLREDSSRPLFGTLGERFVSSSAGDEGARNATQELEEARREEMDVDKENKG